MHYIWSWNLLYLTGWRAPLWSHQSDPIHSYNVPCSKFPRMLLKPLRMWNENMQSNLGLYPGNFWIWSPVMYAICVFPSNVRSMPLQRTILILLVDVINICFVCWTICDCMPYVQEILLRSRSWRGWLLKRSRKPKKIGKEMNIVISTLNIDI